MGDDIYRPMFKRPRLAEEPGDGGMRCDVLRGGGKRGSGTNKSQPAQSASIVRVLLVDQKRKEKKKNPP